MRAVGPMADAGWRSASIPCTSAARRARGSASYMWCAAARFAASVASPPSPGVSSVSESIRGVGGNRPDFRSVPGMVRARMILPSAGRRVEVSGSSRSAALRPWKRRARRAASRGVRDGALPSERERAAVSSRGAPPCWTMDKTGEGNRSHAWWTAASMRPNEAGAGATAEGDSGAWLGRQISGMRRMLPAAA